MVKEKINFHLGYQNNIPKKRQNTNKKQTNTYTQTQDIQTE